MTLGPGSTSGGGARGKNLALGPGSTSGGGARGKNLAHLQNVVFLHQSFLEVHILTTSYQKVFILGP